MSDGSDSELGKRCHSPDAFSEESDKKSTVERRIPKEDNTSHPLPDLLEASSTKSCSESDMKSQDFIVSSFIQMMLNFIPTLKFLFFALLFKINQCKKIIFLDFLELLELSHVYNKLKKIYISP